MRALVTGASGFVGHYLVEALAREGAQVLACGSAGEHGAELPVDLRDVQSMRAALDLAQPDVVFHLAAQTFVPDAIAAPLATYDVNALGTARLLQAVREYAAAAGAMPRVMLASSAEVYGKREPHEFPLRESLDPRPANPYAASKAAAEAIALAEWQTYGLDIIITRAFKHIGPGQSDRFVVASMAAQLARIASGEPGPLLVGNIEAARDFLDVRDVVAAYVALARRGEAGEIYNVCSGRAVKIRDILRELILLAHAPVEVREDPARMRPLDVPVAYGSFDKLRDAIAWEPQIPLLQSLRDIYRAQLDAAGNPPAHR
jgi:GDP-4-dehydro-6-deoxy-D-mannose reductase